MQSTTDTFLAWLDFLRARHAKTLSFRELRKGVVALSQIYVEERARIPRGDVFDGAGKRGAFACFFTPLHFLLVRSVVESLTADLASPRRIVDFGCGLGAAGAAWALAHDRRPEVFGLDRSGWAAAEARKSLAHLGIRGRVSRRDLTDWPRWRKGDARIAAFTVNELSEEPRRRLLGHFLERRGPVVVVEPIARRVNPWWSVWRDDVEAAGGREDEWRFRADLPEEIRELDRAASLDHSELTARSLFLPAPAPAPISA